jgi:signal transduction histidine kinase
LAGNPIALSDTLESISERLNKTIEKVRAICFELIPSVLVDLGLSPALRWLIRSLAEHSDMKVRSNIFLSEIPFSTEQQIAIYRVFQEIITNIRKHAQAGQVSIRIGRDDHAVFFRVEDNGIGFDIERTKSIAATERGLGLATMEERVKMLDGNFEILSRKGTGTKISFKIPVAVAP